MMKPERIPIANATRARLVERELSCQLVVIDATEEEHLHFARELVEYPGQPAQHGRFHSLALFTSSPYPGVGEWKVELGTATARLVSAAHDLDLTSVGLVELDQRVAQESTLQAGRR